MAHKACHCAGIIGRWEGLVGGPLGVWRARAEHQSLGAAVQWHDSAHSMSPAVGNMARQERRVRLGDRGACGPCDNVQALLRRPRRSAFDDGTRRRRVPGEDVLDICEVSREKATRSLQLPLWAAIRRNRRLRQ